MPAVQPGDTQRTSIPVEPCESLLTVRSLFDGSLHLKGTESGSFGLCSEVRAPGVRNPIHSMVFNPGAYAEHSKLSNSRHAVLVAEFERLWVPLRPLLIPYRGSVEHRSAKGFGVSYLVPPPDIFSGTSVRISRKVTDELIVLIGGRDQLALDWLPGLTKAWQLECAQGTVCKSVYLLVEIPGRGFSSGTHPNGVSGVLGYVRSAISMALKQTEACHVAMVGYSLGAAVVTALLSDVRTWDIIKKPERLLRVDLVAPFSNLAEVASRLFVFPGIQGFVESVFSWLLERPNPLTVCQDDGTNRREPAFRSLNVADAVDRLKHLPSEIFRIWVGADDQVCPPDMARSVYLRLRERESREDEALGVSRLYVIPETDHSTVLSSDGVLRAVLAGTWNKPS